MQTSQGAGSGSSDQSATVHERLVFDGGLSFSSKGNDCGADIGVGRLRIIFSGV